MNLTLDEAPKMDVYVVDQSNPAAMSLVRKLCGNFKAGAVILVTEEEHEALKHSVMRIQIPEKAQAA